MFAGLNTWLGLVAVAFLAFGVLHMAVLALSLGYLVFLASDRRGSKGGTVRMIHVYPDAEPPYRTIRPRGDDEHRNGVPWGRPR